MTFLGVCFGSCFALSRLCVQTYFVTCLLLRLEIKLAKWVMCQKSTYSFPPRTVYWACCSPWLPWTVGHTHPAIPRRPSSFQAASTEMPVVKTETRHSLFGHIWPKQYCPGVSLQWVKKQNFIPVLFSVIWSHLSSTVEPWSWSSVSKKMTTVLSPCMMVF